MHSIMLSVSLFNICYVTFFLFRGETSSSLSDSSILRSSLGDGDFSTLGEMVIGQRSLYDDLRRVLGKERVMPGPSLRLYSSNAYRYLSIQIKKCSNGLKIII